MSTHSDSIKFRSVHLWFSLCWLGTLGFFMLAYPTYQTLIAIIMILPFALVALLIFSYVFMFTILAHIELAWEWLVDHVGKLLPRADIGERKEGDDVFGTALRAMLSEDKRDLLYFLKNGPSKERYFILRDISDNRLQWCIDRLGDKTPQVMLDAWEQRMSGTKPKFERGEEGKVL